MLKHLNYKSVSILVLGPAISHTLHNSEQEAQLLLGWPTHGAKYNSLQAEKADKAKNWLLSLTYTRHEGLCSIWTF